MTVEADATLEDYMGGGEGPTLNGDLPPMDDLPFSDLLLSFPQYEIPTEEDCDWTLESGRAQSHSGLEQIEDEFIIGIAYRASIAAGHDLPVTFCVVDNAVSGRITLDNQWVANQHGIRIGEIKLY